MRIVWNSLGAVVLVLLFVICMGYLELRIQLMELGLELTWDLEPLSITTASVAVPESIGLFVIFGLVAAVFLMTSRSTARARVIPAFVGGVSLVTVIVWSMTTTTYESAVPDITGSQEAYGLREIFEHGALSSATLGMAALLLVIGVLRLVPQRKRPAVPAR